MSLSLFSLTTPSAYLFATELLSQLANFGAGPYNGKRKKFRGLKVEGAAAQALSVKSMLLSSIKGRLQGKHLEVFEFLGAIVKHIKSLHSRAEKLIAKKTWEIDSGANPSKYGQLPPIPSPFLTFL